jgi:hypothetical protein
LVALYFQDRVEYSYYQTRAIETRETARTQGVKVGLAEDRTMATRITGNTFPVKDRLKALGGKWNAAAKCWEVPDERADEARALVGPTPLFNSPPPIDLGTADPAEWAARFGRTAVAGAAVRSFTGYGKDPAADGAIDQIEGRRFLQVAHSRPRYYSRDMLEDFDMFGDEPGYQYQWDGVEVEPTDQERAADLAEARAKEEAAHAKEEARARAKAEAAAKAEAQRDFLTATLAEHGLVKAEVVGQALRGADREPVGRELGLDLTLCRKDGRVIGAVHTWNPDFYRGSTAYLTPALLREAEAKARIWGDYWTPEGYGADAYPGPGVPEEELTEDERAEVARLEAARLEAFAASERRGLEISARGRLEDEGLVEPEGRRYAAPKARPVKALSWRLEYGPDWAAYLAEHAAQRRSRRGDTVQVRGVRLVVDLPSSAFVKAPRSRKPPIVESLPGRLRLHNFCEVEVEFRGADS